MQGVGFLQLPLTTMGPRSTIMVVDGAWSLVYSWIGTLRFSTCRYALERTPTFIKIWFWPRYAPNVPPDVWNGSSEVNTDAWGTPTAYFPNAL
jgi:hypothetical protein